LPYDSEGRFYTTRLGDDLKGDNTAERFIQRTASAKQGAKIGAKLGSVVPVAGNIVGATLGGVSGFILGDQETVFPIDMIAIPAYQAYLLAGTPAFQIYIKEGEVLTQVMPTDAMQSTEIVESGSQAPLAKKPRKKSKYHTAYGKHFKAIQADYKLKNGKWKKNGFKRCGAAARKLAQKEMK
jgi:hypothetical protein